LLISTPFHSDTHALTCMLSETIWIDRCHLVKMYNFLIDCRFSSIFFLTLFYLLCYIIYFLWIQSLILKLHVQQVIANFSAVWCGPCKVIAPYYCEMSEKYTSIMFLLVDVDELTVSSEAIDIIISYNCFVNKVP
jgi:thiol-disulfide isomerase/thioredoxin